MNFKARDEYENMMKPDIVTQKAHISDVPKILNLIDTASREGHVLPRPLSYLYDNIRDFWVAKRQDELLACGSLHVSWENLGEIKSLVVHIDSQRKGIGRRIVQKCVEEASQLGLRRLFALTYRPEFFEKLGFTRVDKSELPHKVWQDCIHCPKFPHCEEVALILNLNPSKE